MAISMLWWDVAWACDFFNYVSKPATSVAPVLPKLALELEEPADKAAKDFPQDNKYKDMLSETEIINYDLLDSNKSLPGINNLLPSRQDKEQSNMFAPGFIQEQQAKHEDVIKQKQAAEDYSYLLRNKPKRQDEEIELKKKKSGGDGTPADYSLTDPDDTDEPHNYNDFENPSDLTQTNKYDITMSDINYRMQARPEEFKDKDGVIYWLGNGHNAIDQSRLIMMIKYAGSGDNKRISTILTGFRFTETGKYEAKYRIDYTYSGSGTDLLETRKYDISEGPGLDRLVEKSYYEGGGEDSHIKKTIYYGKDGKIINRREYKYTDGALKEALYYETDSETDGEGELLQKTFFTGAKRKESADYSQSYYTDKATGQRYVTETTVYYYKNGKRASQVEGQEYRYSKSKQITYRGDPDTNHDGALSDEELQNAKKLSMLVYDDLHRLANEEVADYMAVYNAKTGEAAKTIVYFYKDGRRAANANYRECLTSAATYYGNLDANGDGKIDSGELGAGVKASETFYHTEGRLKGEEVQSYTVTYLTDGVTVKDTTFYVYEGDKLAGAADNEDRMIKTVTYWGDAVNGDGTIKADAKKKSETFYQFKPGAKRGEEVADVTKNYYRDGVTVRDTTVYFYKGNKRAEDATNRDGLERTAAFWGDAIEVSELTDSDGDGIADETEIEMGLDLNKADSDGDGFSDKEELFFGSSATDSSDIPALMHDSDGDGLSDSQENTYGTDKDSNDSDGDGMSDLEELLVGTDPNDPDSNISGMEFGRLDSDSDGVPDWIKTLIESSGLTYTSITQDSNGNGESDLFELLTGADTPAEFKAALLQDKNNNGISDLLELLIGM
ncbi:MAG: hypothetical protein Q8N91_00595, partial [Candidatus Omnitrophota bacterium]|nr:hypothetical protein [Candidatus Omnitrophota bacterium]